MDDIKIRVRTGKDITSEEYALLVLNNPRLAERALKNQPELG